MACYAMLEHCAATAAVRLHLCCMPGYLRSWRQPAAMASALVSGAHIHTHLSESTGCTLQAGGNEAVALVNAVLGNIIGIFITSAWLTVFLSVQGAAPYSKVGTVTNCCTHHTVLGT